MIHSFEVENFYSINERQEVNFTTGKRYSDSYSKFNDYVVTKVGCFVGANASGKTNLFRAMSFLSWFAQTSFYGLQDGDIIPLMPHRLRASEPSMFSATFDSNGRLYRYSVVAKQKCLLAETLEVKAERGFHYIYKLTNDDGKINIRYNRTHRILEPINKHEEYRFKTKQNASFLSFLRGAGYLKDIQADYATNGFSNVTVLGTTIFDPLAEAVILSKELKQEETKKRLLPYLKNFDFGIEDFSVMHKRPYGNQEVDIVDFSHKSVGGSFTISAFEESAGTIKGMYLLTMLLRVLDSGGVAVVDEFDARLHYDIARKIISLFANADSNRNNAQLFFSTHQPLFLNDRDKTQIFMCYKEDYLNTEVYRLDELNDIRNSDNFFEKYLSGAYGATPRIGGGC